MKKLSIFLKVSTIMLLVACTTMVTFGLSSDAPELWKSLQTIERAIPEPMDSHPGNVFLDTENVTINVPPTISAAAVNYKIVDDSYSVIKEGKLVKKNKFIFKGIDFGKPGVGWYRVDFFDKNGKAAGWTTVAVLAKLKAPVAQNSPICVDNSNAWHSRDDYRGQEAYASLAAIAGVNWIRDRMSWHDIQREKDGLYLEGTTYDSSANLEAGYGLKVLQVIHQTPRWLINKELDKRNPRGRFPRDLRDIYKYFKEMSKRYQGRIQAWEPWNEANHHVFGSHTVEEMCSFQKASYLGLKSGNPDVTVGWNVYAGLATWGHTEGVLRNETWPYYDTYNIHTYDRPELFPARFEPARKAACGKPMWMTEADRGSPPASGYPYYDLSKEHAIQKAQFMPQSYVTGIYSGCHRYFHFILSEYHSPRTQFGLLRKDMTPNPSYVALAAMGRFLNGARCLGKYELEQYPNVDVFVFRAKPDGKERDVIVAWSEKIEPNGWDQRCKTTSKWQLPKDIKIKEVYDYLGRKLDKAPEILTGSAIYAITPAGNTEGMDLKQVNVFEPRQGEAIPVVLQFEIADKFTVMVDKPWHEEHEHAIEAGSRNEFKFFVYNFGNSAVSGKVEVEQMPQGWVIEPKSWQVDNLETMGRRELNIAITAYPKDHLNILTNWVELKGKFDNGYEPVLAFRLCDKATTTKLKSLDENMF